MFNINRQKRDAVLNSIGMAVMGCLCLGYFLFHRLFAELHLSFGFLNFPVFVGEIGFFLCLVVITIKFINEPQRFSFWHVLLFVFFVFIAVKALIGYSKYGPLALRDAALFYYSFYAAMSYYFCRSLSRNTGWKILFIVAILVILRFCHFYEYALLTFFALAFIFIYSLPPGKLRNVFFILLPLVTPFKLLLYTSRTFLVANVTALIFIAAGLLAVVRLKKQWKILIVVLVFFGISLGIMKVADKNAVKSLVSIKSLRESYKTYNDQIEKEFDTYTMKEFKNAKVYLPEVLSVHDMRSRREDIDKEVKNIEKTLKEVLSAGKPYIASEQEALSAGTGGDKGVGKTLPKTVADTGVQDKAAAESLPPLSPEAKDKIYVASRQLEEYKNSLGDLEVQADLKSTGLWDKEKFDCDDLKKDIEHLQHYIDTLMLYSATTEVTVPSVVDRQIAAKVYQDKHTESRSDAVSPPMRNFEGAQNNSLFRFFIWRDMLVDIKADKPLLGFPFGRPLRSKSLDILHWADQELEKVGWITAHNSYLYIVYKSGIVGVMYILAMFSILFYMITVSLEKKDVRGILLCGISINWFMAANFLVIFELPYNAVIIWCIFGATLAYINRLHFLRADTI